MSQLPSWQLDCMSCQGLCSIPCVAAKHRIVSDVISICFVVLITGLPLTMPSSTSVSFVPLFSATPGGLDPVAAALSQVGLPSPVCAQMTIVPLVNPAVPPVANLLGQSQVGSLFHLG